MLSTSRRVVGTAVALVLAGGASAQDCTWEWVNPTPPRIDIYRLKHEVNAFVGVGAAGNIVRSTDGYRWEVAESDVDADLFGIDWGGGSFVAVGDGAILRSPDGYDWTAVYENSGVVLLDVEFSASRFVAVGNGLDGNFLTSPFGVEWELAPVPWGGGADSIAGSNDGFYVAVGTDIWFSPDGYAWEYQDSVPVSQSFSGESSDAKKVGSDLFELDRVDLAWTGSRLLWASGSDLWSHDLEEEWELVFVLGGCPPFSDWLGVAAGPGWALASGISICPSPYLEPTVSLMVSIDGGETFNDPWETELGGFPGLARYGSRWVAAGALGDVITSSNGATWSCQGGECSSTACADGFVDLASGDDWWVAVGGVGLCDNDLKRRAGGTAARSSDGSRWETMALPGDRFRGVAYLEPEFIGIGDYWIARSTDGTTWTTESSPEGAVLHAVGSGDGWVVTVGQGGALYASDDGLNWIEPFHLVTADLDRVVWDGEQFIVLGRGGTIMLSADVVNWTSALTNATADLKGAAAGEDRRIAVGEDGVILASTDGRVWAPRRSGVSSSLRDVTYAEDRFVAVGWDDHPDGSRPGVVLASTDGVGWTRFSMPGEALKRVRRTEDSWLVVGGDRTIMKIDCLGTLIEAETEHIHVPQGDTIDLEVRLSEDVEVDTPLIVQSSLPGQVSVPRRVMVLADSDTVFVPVTGTSVVAGAILTLSLPQSLGGGSTTILASVEPPQGTPRTPSGRVRP